VPGKLIKLFDTQADWQSGTLENLDATSTPGVIIPTGDYTRTYDSKAEWDQGSKADVVSDTEGHIMLDKPLKGPNGAGTSRYHDDVVYLGQRISPRGLLSFVQMYGSTPGGFRNLRVTRLDGTVLWEQDFVSSGVWSGNPNLLLDEDVIVWVGGFDELESMLPSPPDTYPPGVTEPARRSSGDMWPNYSLLSHPFWVRYRCEYAESGTWTSPWLAHGIADPQSGLVSLRAETPSGTSVTPHVRYSSDGGSTYTDWHDLDDRRMTDVQGTHVQLRLTLATDDPRQTPVVDRAMLLVGKLHRWTSPVIDLAGVDADATLMLSTSQTELDVVREVCRGVNLIPESKRKFEGWTAYQGASVTLTQDQVVPEWGATDATRIQITGGSDFIKYFHSVGALTGTYSLQLRVKNQGTATVRIHSNAGGKTQDVAPGQSVHVKLENIVGNGVVHIQIQFRTLSVEDNLDLIAWRPQVEQGATVTDYDEWQRVGCVFPKPAGWQKIQMMLTLTKTDSVAQSLDKCSLWDAIVLKMLDRPQLTLSPPQVTHVTAYVENSEPLIEYTASLPGVPEAKKVHIRVPVPEGSSLAYCQEVAERVLIGKSKERLALVCQVPLITRLRFSELVPVSIPYIGYTRERPYLARVQKMAHDVLAGNPHTRLWLGDFLPDDAEALVRLLLKEG
jgi:hypothetical protein